MIEKLLLKVIVREANYKKCKVALNLIDNTEIELYVPTNLLTATENLHEANLLVESVGKTGELAKKGGLIKAKQVAITLPAPHLTQGSQVTVPYATVKKATNKVDPAFDYQAFNERV